MVSVVGDPEWRVVIFSSTTVVTLSWKADRDYMLREVSSINGFSLSTVNQTYAAAVAAYTGIAPALDLIYWVVATTAVSQRAKINRKIFKDQTLYYSSSTAAAAYANLFFEAIDTVAST
jgi:hypothetical protein